MNKLQMVQNIILTEVRRVGICSIDDEKLQEAWNIADKIQAEYDEREKEEAEKKRKEMRELLNANNTFIEKEGNHFDDVEWQPDWSQAPEWAEWWATTDVGQAWWLLGEWHTNNRGGFSSVGYCRSDKAPSFNYTGNWRDSLRKRQQ